MPLMAKQMHNAAIIRSMSTREADHMRGRYYMHTGYVPNPSMTHPSYGSVISHQLQRPEVSIPKFISVGGGSMGAGFLGAKYSPFVVNSDGRIRNLDMKVDQRFYQRAYALDAIESEFINQRRGSAAKEHQAILKEAFNVLTSSQMDALKVAGEPENVKERYGDNGFGKGCLMARRLVEAGVPFIEVNLGGWDNHQNIHPMLRDTKLPMLDQGMSALFEDLEQRGLLKDTLIIWGGEFGRTAYSQGALKNGRDHHGRCFSIWMAGGGIKQGYVHGQTDDYCYNIVKDPVHTHDMNATILNRLGIDHEKFTFKFQGLNTRLTGVEEAKVVKEILV